MEVNKLKKNSSVADEGQWIEGLPGMGDLRLKVRSANSRVVRRALNEKMMEDPENQKPEARERVTAEVYAEVVLLDWDNLTNDGQKVEFDRELARQWLVDPDMDDFYQIVENASMEASRRTKARTDSLAKN